MSDDSIGSEQVRGERQHSVARAISMQTRLSNLLAFGLMSVLGLGSLAWYYAKAMARQGQLKHTAQTAAANSAQGDAPLPSLGRIDPPALPFKVQPPLRADFSALPDDDAPLPKSSTLPELPLAPIRLDSAPAGQPVKSAALIARERALNGEVFSSQHTSGGSSFPGSAEVPSTSADYADEPREPGLIAADVAHPGAASIRARSSASEIAVRQNEGELAALLHEQNVPAARVKMLAAQRLVLPKGAFIDCTLETAIDSTLPGMTTCITATDTFGVDGKVVLMERGTKLTGETRGQVQQGAARVFVLWTEARTPTGVIVPLDSPGADELGRSGLAGKVERHFWQRFGAAMLVSVFDAAVLAGTQSSRSGSNVIVAPSSQDVVTDLLKSTVNIPPTVIKRNGDRIQILAARDLDFRSVYELHSNR